MRLLQFASRYPEPARLITARTILQRPQANDYQSWADLRGESANFLRPFEPAWTPDELSKSAFRARLRRQEADISSGRGLPWFVFNRENPDVLMGGLTISNIRRGVAETGTLGYWMGEKFADQGYMKEALLAVCEDVFNVHNLHRIEAATVLENKQSQGLLRRCGFQEEGVARKYLRINGEWRDHILFARLAEDRP
ncbi:MAG: GNAT family N-acetyltransferase [Rhizobiaceae bacterium]|nr:GNAT family N-acetyltransferase [Rhizobiaceae bacterium]